MIDERSSPKSSWKTVEDSSKISATFDLPAQGWNAYIKPDGRHAAKAVSGVVVVEKNNHAIIHHLDSCTEIGSEKIRQEDGSWA